MYWYNYLYADKKVHHISRLKYKIEKGMPHKGVYLIHLPECGSPAAADSHNTQRLLRIVTLLQQDTWNHFQQQGSRIGTDPEDH